jgi:hypothetical protein
MDQTKAFFLYLHDDDRVALRRHSLSVITGLEPLGVRLIDVVIAIAQSKFPVANEDIDQEKENNSLRLDIDVPILLVVLMGQCEESSTKHYRKPQYDLHRARLSSTIGRAIGDVWPERASTKYQKVHISNGSDV